MNKVNFDSLSAYKAPEDWINKAAAIPDTAVQKRPPFRIYRVVAAASIVLVSVAGLLVFLFFGNGGSTPVAIREGGTSATDSRSDETVVSETTETGAPAETIAVLSTDADGNPVVVYQEPPASTENGTRPTDGSRSSTESALSPTSSTDPTITYATEKPLPTEPPAGITPSPTDAHAVPDSPSTEPPLTDCRITVTAGYPSPAGETPSVETAEPIVFCRMYDASDNIVGSGSLFAEEKRATVVSIDPDDTFVVTYDPLEKGLPITRGRYTYVMVDYHTGAELCRGSIVY